MLKEPLSPADLRILDALQQDGRISNVELADKVGLSPSPCLRRTRALEENGLIRGYRAILDPKALGLGVEVFIQVSIERHRDEDAEAFRRAVAARREIVACHVMTGDMDFLLHVLARDLESFGHFVMKVLLKMPGVKDVRSSFVLEVVKSETAIPLDHAPRG